MSIKSEFEKKESRRLASKFDGTSMADSFTVSSRYNRLICQAKKSQNSEPQVQTYSTFRGVQIQKGTFSFQASVIGSIGKFIAPSDANNSKDAIPESNDPP